MREGRKGTEETTSAQIEDEVGMRTFDVMVEELGRPRLRGPWYKHREKLPLKNG